MRVASCSLVIQPPTARESTDTFGAAPRELFDQSRITAATTTVDARIGARMHHLEMRGHNSGVFVSITHIGADSRQERDRRAGALT
jgi:hypothetical protein